MALRISRLLPLILVGVSCTSPMQEKLHGISSFIDERPDSALVVLRGIDESQLGSDGEKAHYYLLMTKAEDKNYIDNTDAGNISFAADYFDRYGPDDLRMLAWYYKGIVHKNAGEYNSSIVALEKAERVARKIGDWFYLGLTLRNKASVFSLTNNFAAAIEARAESVDCFDKAGKDYYAQFARLALAIDHVNNKSYGEAEEIATVLAESDIESVADQSRLLLAGIWTVLQSRTPDSLIVVYRGVPDRFFDITDYCYYARNFELVGMRDSVDYYIEKAYRRSSGPVPSAEVDYMYSEILQLRGNTEEALPLLKNALETQDSLTRVLLSQSLSVAQREYYKGELGRQELKTRLQSQKKNFYLLSGILSIGFMLVALMLVKRRKDSIIKEKIYLLASEKASANDTAASLVGRLLNVKMEGLEALSRQFVESEGRKSKSRIISEFGDMCSKLGKDKAAFKDLEEELDTYCDGVMSKFKAQFPDVKKDRLILASLFFAKMPYPQILSITSSLSIESIKMAKSRLRREIEASDAPDKEIFLRLLKK